MNGSTLLLSLLCGILVLAVGLSNHQIKASRPPLPAELYALKAVDRQYNETDTSNVVYRLPNNTRPIAYNLRLSTNIHSGDFSFKGQVSITVEVLTTGSRSISLHYKSLDIGAVRLIEVNNDKQKSIPLGTPIYTEVTSIFEVRLASDQSDLIVGQRYLLIIEFAGTMRTDIRGFFRSSYVTEDGSRRWIAATHFEPTNARAAFPCFDEPAIRANFTVSISHGSGYHALSNMPVSTSYFSEEDQLMTTVFAETPSMPTYLVAFAVTDFAMESDNSISNVEQRIFARPAAINRSAFGLETGRRILDAFETNLGVKYSLPKMDQIALPRFGGGMENWGLIVYGEYDLLESEWDDIWNNDESIVSIVVHEVAHQWFGNHVTNRWWSFNWMKEGFATLYEFHGADWLFPEWSVLDDFVYKNTQGAMFIDSYPSYTRSMSHHVESPYEIASVFDTIAYAKAGSVLHMFLHAFTEKRFTQGLNIYLSRHAHGATVEEDLFAALQETVIGNGIADKDFSVANVMSSWTRQSGFPVVTAERNYTSGTVRLQQQRYWADPFAQADNATFWVPYNLATASEANFSDTQADGWLSPKTVGLELGGLRSDDWLIVNKRETGYYRVQYDERNYELLAKALMKDHSVIHVASRSQIIDDLFALAQSERLGYGIVFDLIKYLKHESEFVPWASAWRGLEQIDRLYSGSAHFGKYKAYIVKLLTHLYTESARSAEPKQRRAHLLAVRWSCQYGSSQCQADTNILLQSVLFDKMQLHPKHRAVVLCAGMRSATEPQRVQLWSWFQGESDERVRNDLIDAMACSAQSTRSLLEVSLNEAGGAQWTSIERFRLLSAVVKNRESSAEEALDVFTERLEMYDEKDSNLAVELLADRVHSEVLRSKFDSLLLKSRSVILEMSYQKSTDVIRNNQRWIRRNQKVIDDWIEIN